MRWWEGNAQLASICGALSGEVLVSPSARELVLVLLRATSAALSLPRSPSPMVWLANKESFAEGRRSQGKGEGRDIVLCFAVPSKQMRVHKQ